MIRRFNVMEGSIHWDGVSFLIDAEVVNNSRSTLRNVNVLFYVSRYGTQGRDKYWAELRRIPYLQPGAWWAVNGLRTEIIPREQHVSVTIEVFVNRDTYGRPDAYRDRTNIYTGDYERY